MKITVDYRPPRGRVTCTPGWTSSAFEKAKAFPGRKRLKDKVLYFELTENNIAYARSAFRGAEHVGLESKSRLLADGPRGGFDTRFPQTALQVEAFNASRGKRLFAFFEKPGAGKTKIVLDWAADLWFNGEIDGLFILSFSGVHEQWVLDEAPKHMSPRARLQATAWMTGKRLDESIFEPNGDRFRLFAMNYEAYATSKKGFQAAKRFAASGQMAAAMDESQRIKSSDSVVSEKAIGNRDDWHARALASGEPTPLGLEDYYSQFCFLDPKIIGCWTFEGFKNMFCRTTKDIKRKVIGYVNQEHLHRLMSPYVHVGAPDIKAKQIFQVSRFDLGPKTRKAYDQLKEELMVDLEGVSEGEWKEYRLLGPLAKLTKLREVACGRLTDRDGEVHHFDDNRIKLLRSLLDIYEGQKVIIWSCFKADHESQKAMLGDRAAIYNGDTPKARRREIVQQFLDPNSDLQWLLGSTAAMGTGLNLQGSSWLNIYYSNDNNAGNRWQSERRLYRLGVDRDVLNIDIAARNTVDVGTINSNRRKRDVSDMSINEFKSLLQEDEIDDSLLI